MEKLQTLLEFYQSKLNWVPDTIRKDIGHFNVFKLDDFVKKNSKPIPYSRKDYFKISLIVGRNKIHYADKDIEIKKQALFFANPQVPYNWERLDEQQTGFFCVFTPEFFHQFGKLTEYEMFQPNSIPVYELSNDEMECAQQIFHKMEKEIVSEYNHKYDLLRTFVFELMHLALKIVPVTTIDRKPKKAPQRTTILFLELLERQFPIDNTNRCLALRSPSDFARQLSIHVNHLNRAVKLATEKTTSQLIAERILQEAKILLKHTEWNISEIAFSLGFKELTHFNNFFKKYTDLNPTQFKNV